MIDLSNYTQFELNSKVGNSMKESKMRILRHMEEINGRRFNKRSSDDDEFAVPMSSNDKNQSPGSKGKNSLSNDYGMQFASQKANSMINYR